MNAETSAPKVLETPATSKKKMQMWVLASVGLLLAFLMIMTVVNIINRSGEQVKSEEALPPVEQPAGDPKANSSQEQFDQLVQSRKAAVQARSTEPTVDPKTGAVVAGKPGPDGKPVETPYSRWQQDELIRALRSVVGPWGGSGGAAQGEAATAQRQPAVGGVAMSPEQATVAGALAVPPKPSADMSLDERRADVRRRIEEAQRLRQQLLQGMNTGGGPEKVEPVRTELEKIVKTFHEPPVDVVGYTKENPYNADIAGKLSLLPGTLIPMQNMGKSISDYSGPINLQVTRDVYDRAHENILIPKGSTGVIKSVRVQNVNEPIQARMGFAVTSVILPNGKVIDLSKAASVVDREGVAAVKDEVNRHILAQFLGVAAYALISNGTSYQGSGSDNDADYAGTVGAGAREQFKPLAQKYLSIVPTITIKPGQSMNVFVESELFIEPWRNLYADYME